MQNGINMSVGALDSALSGLRTAQQQLNVISGNVSNASTPGYTRKILPQSADSIYGVTIGVKGDAIIRTTDVSLSRDLWTQVSSVSALDTQALYLNKIQQFHGDPADEISIGAEIAQLRDNFSALSDSPENVSMQRNVITQAQTVVKRFNDYGAMLNNMRNDTQNDMTTSVNKINTLLGQIARLNQNIQFNTAIQKTVADYQDQRDQAVKSLSEELNVTTYQRGDGVLVVQTATGVQLADGTAETVYFGQGAISANNYYPVSAGGIYVGGNPAVNKNAINITTDPLGGRLGALITLRDQTLPQYQAQIDELAQKTALRLDEQGLRLFTDQSGTVPANANPVPNPPGPLSPVTYVGFSSRIQVNSAILLDPTLVQKGTAPVDVPVQSGSNEVIRRVTDFAFGDVQYQQAAGTVDIRAAATGTTTMQDWLGISSTNQVTSSKALSNYADIASLLTAGGSAFSTGDQLTLTFQESRTGTGPSTITLDLSNAATNFPIGPGINDGLDQIIAEINARIAALPVPASLGAVASRNSYGQLVINSTGNIAVASSGAGSMGSDGLQFLGLTAGTTVTKDPYIEIQVGKDKTYRVTIEPGEDETDLLDKLEYDPLTGSGIPGLYASISGSGRLTLRPGGDDSNGGPRFGGDIRISGGPFAADGTGGSGAASGAGIVKALFGSDSPVADVLHSTTNPFRTTNLGPGANVSTGPVSTTSLIDYGQQLVNRQTEDINRVEAQGKDEKSFRDTLQTKLSDKTGVNIDEELANMIVVQTAYAASARTITAVNTLFQQLLDSFR